MKVFTRDYRITHYSSPAWGAYFSGRKPCVLDIETTGLTPSRCKVILIALLTETEDGIRITQFLAQNHYEEHKVLEGAISFLRDENIDYLVTYNGTRFDVPFINTRLEVNGFAEKLNLYHFDLYRFIKKHSELASRMSSLTQMSVERYFGIAGDRKDTITGRESVSLFNEYALDGSGTTEKIILTHNREDVLQLYKLMKYAGAMDFRDHLKTDFHTAIASYGFPSDDGRYSIRPSIVKDKLVIRGDQLSQPVAAAYFPDDSSQVTAIFNSTLSNYEISVPLMQHAREYFVDVRSLGLEDVLQNDPEFVNGYLILNSRSANCLAKLMVERYTT